jgi:hypothetical protein
MLIILRVNSDQFKIISSQKKIKIKKHYFDLINQLWQTSLLLSNLI